MAPAPAARFRSDLRLVNGLGISLAAGGGHLAAVVTSQRGPRASVAVGSGSGGGRVGLGRHRRGQAGVSRCAHLGGRWVRGAVWVRSKWHGHVAVKLRLNGLTQHGGLTYVTGCIR